MGAICDGSFVVSALIALAAPRYNGGGGLLAIKVGWWRVESHVWALPPQATLGYLAPESAGIRFAGARFDPGGLALRVWIFVGAWLTMTTYPARRR